MLRRWLRRDGFVRAMNSLRDAMRFQADFQLLSAAASASQILHSSAHSNDHEAAAAKMKAFADLLKLAHVRERFARDEDEPPIFTQIPRFAG